MTCAVGPAHPNSGDISVAHLFGALYVGGSGMWRFDRVPLSPSTRLKAVRHKGVGLRSDGLLWDEIRAGVAIALDFGRARAFARKHDRSSDTALELDANALRTIAAEADGLSIGLLVTSVDQGLLDQLSASMGETDWSIVMCGPQVERRQTQWMKELVNE